jgi:AcrR family transcriptional regulator
MIVDDSSAVGRAADTDRRLELALRAAEVLEREGLDISTERLASALGIKRPTFLYYFPTHGHVVEAALVALLTEQAAVVTAAVEQHTHPIDRLFAQMQAVHAFHRGREHRVVFLSQAIATLGGERGREIVQRATEVFAAQRHAAAERVRQGIAEGTVAPCDADALVATVRALTDGLMVQRVTDGLDLAAAHALAWVHLLAPLKTTRPSTAAKTRPSTAAKTRPSTAAKTRPSTAARARPRPTQPARSTRGR